MMGIRSGLPFLIRALARATFYILILSLPVTIFPIISGVAGGVSLHFWNRRQVEQHTNALTFEIERNNNLNYWNVPGALTIHEFFDQKGPFHIPGLKSLDWSEKLGFILPNEHYFDQAVGIDKVASLDGLVRKATPDCAGYPTRYWVYVTSFPEWLPSPWDNAFSSLLQRLYVNPLSPDTGIYHLDCSSAGFLCGVWGVKYPSLVYFEVENETLADRKAPNDDYEDGVPSKSDWLNDLLTPEYTYSYPDTELLPVTVRIIELPLDGDDAEKLLPRNTLPTPALQLRTLILDLVPEDIQSMWEEYSPATQMLRRFQDYHDESCERRGTAWYYFTESDSWYSDHVFQPIFGKQFTGRSGGMNEIQSIFFTVTTLAAELVRLPFTFGWSVYSWFFGLGWDGLPLGTHTLPNEWADGGADAGGGANMWDDMMAGFWESVAKNISAQENEKAGRAAVTGAADA